MFTSNRLLERACNNCTNSTPFQAITPADLEADCPVSLDKLATVSKVFCMPTTATNKCISEEAAIGLLSRQYTPQHTLQDNMRRSVHEIAFDRKAVFSVNNRGNKLRFLAEKLNLTTIGDLYFEYKCPMTRHESIVRINAKYKLAKPNKPTIIECREVTDLEIGDSGEVVSEAKYQRVAKSDKFRLEYAVLKMIYPWFSEIPSSDKSYFAQYNPFAFYAKTILKIGEKTHCYKLLTAVVTITDVSIRLFIIIGSNYLFYKLITLQAAQNVDGRAIANLFFAYTAMNAWFSTQGVSKIEAYAYGALTALPSVAYVGAMAGATIYGLSYLVYSGAKITCAFVLSYFHPEPPPRIPFT